MDDPETAMSCAELGRDMMHSHAVHDIFADSVGGIAAWETAHSNAGFVHTAAAYVAAHDAVAGDLGAGVLGTVTYLGCLPAELGSEGGAAIGHTLHSIFAPEPQHEAPAQSLQPAAPAVAPDASSHFAATPADGAFAVANGPDFASPFDAGHPGHYASLLDSSPPTATTYVSLLDAAPPGSFSGSLDAPAFPASPDAFGHPNAFESSSVASFGHATHDTTSTHDAGSSHGGGSHDGGTSHGSSMGGSI